MLSVHFGMPIQFSNPNLLKSIKDLLSPTNYGIIKPLTGLIAHTHASICWEWCRQTLIHCSPVLPHLSTLSNASILSPLPDLQVKEPSPLAIDLLHGEVIILFTAEEILKFHNTLPQFLGNQIKDQRPQMITLLLEILWPNFDQIKCN